MKTRLLAAASLAAVLAFEVVAAIHGHGTLGEEQERYF